MRYVLIIAAVGSALSAAPAGAIEMFTNLNNGTNIGFPPMEVPTSIYGRGGWHRGAMHGPPIRTNPPIPAMMPSGFNSGYTHPTPSTGPVEVIGRGEDETQLVADRRSRRGGVRSSQSSSAAPQADRPTTSDYFAPHPAKPLTGDTDESTGAPAETALHPVMLRAVPGIAPEASGNDNDSEIKMRRATSSRRDASGWSAEATTVQD